MKRIPLPGEMRMEKERKDEDCEEKGVVISLAPYLKIKKEEARKRATKRLLDYAKTLKW